jgi:inner membrane protein|tara:strand:+ start:191 stop:742 length:552 start_codon:yes stop_codon:yes gene_type:complete
VPTIFTHSLIGIAASRLAPQKLWFKRFLTMSLIASIIPDIDVIGIPFGVPYGHVLAHRGLTHSIIFTIPFSILLLKLFFRKETMFSSRGSLMIVYLILIIMSHGFLDALSNGSNGVALLWPFNNERLFFPITPITDASISTSFFGELGYRVMLNEILIIWIPVTTIVIFNESRITLSKWKKLK